MAVFTTVSELAFEEFATAFGLDPPYQLNPILEGIENTNYRASTGSGEYVLTLLEGRSKEFDAEHLSAILDHLHDRGLPVPRPMRTPDGSHARLLMDRQAILVTFLSGQSVADPSKKHCALAGQSLAKLHLAGQDIEGLKGNIFGVGSWRDYFDKYCDKIDLGGEFETQAVTDEIDFLAENWPSGLAAGLVHADFFPDNLLFDDGAVSGLLDFYYACKDLLAYDLAIALTAWCGPAQEWPRPALIRSFLDGYESVRLIEGSERQALPLLLRGACLRFALTRLYDWSATPKDAMIRKKNPMEYILKLETAKNLNGLFQ
jgi:homoserine kinase type II